MSIVRREAKTSLKRSLELIECSNVLVRVYSIHSNQPERDILTEGAVYGARAYLYPSVFSIAVYINENSQA